MYTLSFRVRATARTRMHACKRASAWGAWDACMLANVHQRAVPQLRARKPRKHDLALLRSARSLCPNALAARPAHASNSCRRFTCRRAAFKAMQTHAGPASHRRIVRHQRPRMPRPLTTTAMAAPLTSLVSRAWQHRRRRPAFWCKQGSPPGRLWRFAWRMRGTCWAPVMSAVWFPAATCTFR